MNTKIYKQGRKIASLIVALAAVMGTLQPRSLAQEPPQPGTRPAMGQVMIAGPGERMAAQGIAADGPSDVTYQFISSEMSFEGTVVKGAPFSAEATTETTQVLADGNRITHKNTANLYRDAEGRTRREQTIEAIGPWTATGAPPQIITINDPVAGANYILEPNTHTARKLPSRPPGKAGAIAGQAVSGVAIMRAPGAGGREGASGGTAGAMAVPLPGPGPEPFTLPLPGPEAGTIAAGGGPVIMYRQMTTTAMPKGDPPQSEPLGQQTIGGVTAQGTRTTMTIPAGQIGNELPIQVVSERWYSPELSMVVMTKVSDPRFGTNVYQLSNVRREAPAASLFEVPADYTVQEAPKPGVFLQQKMVK